MTPEGVTGALRKNRREGRREDEFKRVKGGDDGWGGCGMVEAGHK